MTAHNEILILIEALVDKNTNSTSVRRACLSLAKKLFPENKSLTTNDVRNLFGYGSNTLPRQILETKEKKAEKGNIDVYSSEKLRIVYYKIINNIPLSVLASFVFQRGLVLSEQSFLDNFSRDASSYKYKKFFRVKKNIFGKNAMSIETVRRFLCFLKLQKYVTSNWYTVEDVLKIKKISHTQVIDWINKGEVEYFYQFNRKFYISPKDYLSIANSRKTDEVAVQFGISLRYLRRALSSGSLTKSTKSFGRFSVLEQEFLILSKMIEEERIFLRSKRKSIRQSLQKNLVDNRDFYEAGYSVLKGKDFNEMSFDEQLIIVMSAKARFNGALELLFKAFSTNIASLVKHWLIRVRFSSADEIAHIAKIGLIFAVDRYADHKDIPSYFHKTMEWEIKKHFFDLWKQRKVMAEINHI